MCKRHLCSTNGMQGFPNHYQISKRIWKTYPWDKEACAFTCWCSLLWEGRSSLRSHRACSRSHRSPSIPPYTCHNVALPPQACKGSHHCWGHRRSLSWKAGQLIQPDGRSTLQQREHTRTNEWLDDLCRCSLAIPKLLPFTTYRVSLRLLH